MSWTSRTRLLSLVSCSLLVFSTLVAAVVFQDPRWKEVEDAMSKGLPKTAIEKLNPIITQALTDKKYDTAARAIAQKLQLEAQVDGQPTSQPKLQKLQAELAKAPAELKPVLQAILANWYWEYLQINRWQFQQRTQTATPPGDDIDTWALPQILDEIDRQFARSLESAEALKKVPIAQFDDLFLKGTLPDSYRPTLYDMLAQSALAFYTTPEQAAAKEEFAYELKADSPIFAPLTEFLAWENADPTHSRTSKAIALYQDLLRFHQNDANTSALYDLDLMRLEFGKNTAVGDEKAARYKAALRRGVDAYSDHEISSRFLLALAAEFQADGDLVQAHKLAEQGRDRFPESPGAKACYNLIQQLEAPSLQISTERVWNAPLPTIDVSYQNLTKVYFRAVPLDFNYDVAVRGNLTTPEQLDQAQQKALLQKKPVLTWSADLPATADYKPRTEAVPAPPDRLKPGWYFLIASRTENFAEAPQNILSISDFWVSELAIVTRHEPGTGRLSGFVLNAVSGEPIAGATVRAWGRTNQNQGVALPPVQTDSNGLYQFQVNSPYLQLRVYATHGTQALTSANLQQLFKHEQPPRIVEQTVFFTDRVLYRPGQTIQFKGICTRADQDQDAYQVIPRRALTVLFRDANGQEIERVNVTSNDYGSISGSFTAPRDRLLGQMTLHVEGQPQGMAAVRVEEYKRPKFQVKLEPPTEPARLNGEVKLRGTALAYTGAPVYSNLIKYRVVRQVRYPAWWGWRCWWMPPMPQASQEIAHGTVAATKPDGSFEIAFTARPDLSVPESSEPTFQYSVNVDVTDSAGETRSASQSINVGYTALAATLSAENWQEVGKPVQITVRTTTLNGQNAPAQGTLKVYALTQPAQVKRAPLNNAGPFAPPFPIVAAGGAAPGPDPANPNSWENGEVVFEQAVATDATGTLIVPAELKAGIFRATLESTDPFGKKVTAELPVRVLDPSAGKFPIKLANLVAVEQDVRDPGQELRAIWGSGYSQARAFVEVEHRQKVIKSFWTELGATQQTITMPVSEAMRGGFTLRVTMVRENRLYTENHHITVPWANKNLTVKWEHFVSKLEPGQKETWTAVVTGPDAKPAAAEFVAALYDASLDAFQPHAWPAGFSVFRTDYSNLQTSFENQLQTLMPFYYAVQMDQKDASYSYRHFPPTIVGFQGAGAFTRFQGVSGRMYGMGGRMDMYFMGGGMDVRAKGAAAPARMMSDSLAVAAPAPASALGMEVADFDQAMGEAVPPPAPGAGAGPAVDLGQVSARKNLNETAFFFPHLVSNKDGEVRIEFTMPEALTEWKFLGFAHDQDLRAGLLTDKVVTAKELMIQPNAPRFVREGDTLEFTVKVSNQSAARQTGTVRLSLADLVSLESVDAKLGNSAPDQAFDIPAGESKGFSWKLRVPDGLNALSYKAVGSTGRLSDGEEGYLPVLPRRVLVRESLPLPLRGKGTKEFTFQHLIDSGKSDSLRNQTLTVQMVSNPSWYAVMALPYLMEYPYECSEQTFNRLYANALARHIAGSDPKIRRVFDAWKLAGGNTLDSPLEKNQDLKTVLLEETPWVRQAQVESQGRRNVGILFDENRLNSETGRLLAKLAEQQLGDGRWPWFPGGPANDYITLYIATGFGRLRHLGVKPLDVAPAVKALDRLDAWLTEQYNQIPADKRAGNHLSSLTALYLYGRSFFLQDQPVAGVNLPALQFWLGQAKQHWLALPRQNQGQLAVALKRFGDGETARGIVASLKERSTSDEEMGMYWRNEGRSWWWYQAPIETQAMMIEAFDEVTADAQAVEDCKVWLLKQKQTQDWKTTKATADAVYGLLLRGTNLLASNALVEVSLGGQKIEPVKAEAGTGFYEQRFSGPEIKPDQGKISTTKTDAGVAWGSVHWQYLEDMSKVPTFAETPLKLTKSLYTKVNTDKGPTLVPVNGPVHVGDELVVRVVLKTDRDMEFIHLKDFRGSGTEPVNVLSGYRFQDGLSYYESTRDTATHFFIDYLRTGTYVFEYSVRVQLRGDYQTGFASIESMYAPEFNSHSESLELKVE